MTNPRPINPDGSEAGALGWFQRYQGENYLVASVCRVANALRDRTECYCRFDQALMKDPDTRVTLVAPQVRQVVELTGPQFLANLRQEALSESQR